MTENRTTQKSKMFHPREKYIFPKAKNLSKNSRIKTKRKALFIFSSRASYYHS
jgi:hypothetical protein